MYDFLYFLRILWPFDYKIFQLGFRDRPFNLLVLVYHAITTLSRSVHVPTMFVLVIQSDIESVFGNTFCKAWTTYVFFGHVWNTFGVLGQASFRLLLIKGPPLFVKPTVGWVMVTIIISVTMWADISMVAAYISQTAPNSYIMEMCHGHNSGSNK